MVLLNSSVESQWRHHAWILNAWMPTRFGFVISEQFVTDVETLTEPSSNLRKELSLVKLRTISLRKVFTINLLKLYE